MITTGAKLWFGVAGFAAAALVAYLLFSGAEDFGTLVLIATLSGAAILGVLVVLLRDGDHRPPAGEDGEGEAVVPPHVGRQLPAAWPALGALGVGVTLVGLAAGGALFYVGLGILAVTVVEWMVQGWAERSSADRSYNLGLRNRIMYPVEIPALAVIVIAVILLAFSRVLLALPQAGSTIIAVTVATLVLAGGALVASRPRVSSSLLTVLAVVGAVGLLGGGIVGAVAGEREFKEEEEEEEGGAAEGDLVITVTDEGFDPETLSIPAGEPVTIVFRNEDSDDQPHALQIQGIEGAEGTEEILGGEEATIEIAGADPGEYTFIDPNFPNELEGTIMAEEGLTEPAEGGEPEEDGGSEDADADDEEGSTEVSSP